MSDPTAPPPGGEQYPPAGGYPPPAQPGGYPPQPGGYPPQPGGYPPQPGYPPPGPTGYQPYGQPAYGPPAAGGPGGYATLANGTTVKVADFAQRALARIIDAVLVGVVVGILYSIVIAGTIASTEIDPVTGEIEEGAGLVVLWFASFGIFLALSILYEVALIAVRGQTVGKQLMGAKVVDQDNGELIGWGRSFLRWLVPQGASLITCGIGGIIVLLSPLFDKRGKFQGWHDQIAKDMVISLK